MLLLNKNGRNLKLNKYHFTAESPVADCFLFAVLLMLVFISIQLLMLSYFLLASEGGCLPKLSCITNR